MQGYDSARGTQAGDEGSRRYNLSLQLATLRHAVIAHLRDPPRGYAEVVRRHFAMCRVRLVAQARRWVIESYGTELYARFVHAEGELLKLLAEIPAGCDADGTEWGVLPPRADDTAAVAQDDSSLAGALAGGGIDNDSDDWQLIPM